MYLIQASPLTKMFIPEYQEACLEDPKLLFDGSPFDVIVKRGCGDIKLTHGKPVHAATLLPRQKNRIVEDDEITPLYEWLTDEQKHETHMYGIVGVKIETDVSAALMAMVAEGASDKKAGDLMREIKKNLHDSIVDARKRADQRVMQHCRTMYNTVRETWDYMQKNGRGVYNPSYSEALSMEVLKEEIQSKTRALKMSQEKFSQTMAQLSTEAMQ